MELNFPPINLWNMPKQMINEKDISDWREMNFKHPYMPVPKKEEDVVNHPNHYTFGKYEVLPVLLDWFETDPLLWQVGKYIARATRKGNEVQDLEKAEFYLKERIARAKQKGNTN